MNLTTLAKLSGVSVATVSKAFSGSDEISDDTKERIFSLAKQYNCFDKYNKNKFEKKVIAVICPELNSNYYNAFITLLNREINARNQIMTVSVGEFSAGREQELFSYYSSYCKADGIIVVNPNGVIDNANRIPAVAIGNEHIGNNIDFIRLNFSDAIEDAIFHLKALGHTRIGFVGETLTASKLSYFQAAMKKAALPLSPSWVYTSRERFEKAGIQAAETIWRSEAPPTAVLAAYDDIAIGMIKRLRQNNVRIPEDISIVGMDDIASAPYLETSLSSIRTHTQEACRTAVELLMKKIENSYYSPKQTTVISSQFIPRESTGKISYRAE